MNACPTKSTGFVVWVVLAAMTALAGCSYDYTGSGGADDDFLSSGRTSSFFTAFQVDPRSEDSAGPQFVAADDLNGDGLVDLVSAWNQSQPVQVHLQRRTASGAIWFETATLAGSVPIVAVSGLAVADFDLDSHPDVAVLVKESLVDGPGCLDSEQPEEGLSGLIVLYLAPTDPDQTPQALAWEEVQIESSFLQGSGGDLTSPEIGGFSSMTTGDMDLDGDTDIVVAWNSECDGGTRDAVIFSNLGPGSVRDGTWVGTRITDGFPKGESLIKDVAVADIDGDGDLDIAATFPLAQTMNVRWYRNPTVDVPDDYHLSDNAWQVGTVGQIDSGADTLEVADIDLDGITDIVVRSTAGQLIQWLKGPEGPTTAPLRALPWQVYTLAKFTDYSPQAVVAGDLNFDGMVEVVAAGSGGLAWFDSRAAQTIYDPWAGNLIINEGQNPSTVETVAIDTGGEPAEAPTTTVMNSIIIVDVDGDGAEDIVATLDRSQSDAAGLTNDAIVWFRNDANPPR
jgi:hypothetical protein